MTAVFRTDRRRRPMAVFEPVEVALLRGLVGQLVELVDEGLPQGAVEEADWAVELGLADVGVSGPTMPPEDPVLRRLFPNAYADGVGDPDSSAEFRRFTETGLRRTKSSRARTVLDCLAEPPPEPDEEPAADDGDPVTVRLDPGQTQAWLTVLTDLRLALAIRLGIETEADAADLDALAQAELVRLRRARRRLRGARPAEPDGDPRVGVYQVYSWLGLLQESLVGALE